MSSVYSKYIYISYISIVSTQYTELKKYVYTKLNISLSLLLLILITF